MGLKDLLNQEQPAATVAEPQKDMGVEAKPSVGIQQPKIVADKGNNSIIDNLQASLNASQDVEPLGDFTPLAAGGYSAIITDADFVKTKTRDGSGKVLLDKNGKPKIARDMFKMEVTVSEGQDKGKKEIMCFVYGGTEDWAARNMLTMKTYLQRFGADITSGATLFATAKNIIDKPCVLEIVEGTSKSTGNPYRIAKLDVR